MKHAVQPQPYLPRLRMQYIKKQPQLKEKLIQHADEHKLEKIVEQRRFQREMIELINHPQSNDDAVHSITDEQVNSLTKEDFLKHYRNQPSKPSQLREKALKGIHPMDQRNYRNNELKKLDGKVQIINEHNPLEEEWKSPFLMTQSQTQSMRQLVPIDTASLQDLDLKPTEQCQALLNENFKGFGNRLRSYLDFDKHSIFFREGNPKCVFRDQFIRVLKKRSSRYLDLVKQWNELLVHDRLMGKQLLKLEEIKLMQQFGTMSSISQYQSIQDFHKNKTIKIQQQQSLQSNTPISQFSPVPQFVVKNSRQSNSSGKEMQFDFGKTQEQPEFEDKEQSNIHDSDTTISRETFLTYCQVFWDLVRKEDEIVERVVWAFCQSDRFTFSGFKQFYKLLVFCSGTVDEYIRFAYDFFMGSDREEVPFSEIQGLLRILTNKIDSKIKGDTSLSDQILLDIVNYIHRPSLIPRDTLWQVIYEDKIPATLVARLVYDN